MVVRMAWPRSLRPACVAAYHSSIFTDNAPMGMPAASTPPSWAYDAGENFCPPPLLQFWHPFGTDIIVVPLGGGPHCEESNGSVPVCVPVRVMRQVLLACDHCPVPPEITT